MTQPVRPHELNVLGPFYVEDGCGASCGVPQMEAPMLFSENDEEHCYVRKQPESAAELEAIRYVMAMQDVLCIRYRGRDPKMISRIIQIGEGAQCDLLSDEASPPEP